MAKKDKDGNWIDSKGVAVPVQYIDPMSKERDKLVEYAFTRIYRLEQAMKKAKSEILDKIADYNEKLKKENNLDDLGKGNRILTGFTGDKQIEVKINDLITINDNFTAFEQRMDNWLDENLQGSSEKIRVIIKRALRRDKRGNHSVKELLRLRSLHIKDKEWKAMMELLENCMEVQGSRMYMQARRRDNDMDAMKTVDLNFSTI